MDIRTKKRLIQDNIFACKYGIYKGLSVGRTQKNFFNYNVNMAPPCEYCNVDVRNTHILDTAYSYLCKGFKPVILNIVSDEYNGGNIYQADGFSDELIFFRTNINQTTSGFNLYPVSGSEVTYAPIVHIIRNDNLQLLHPSQISKISVITASLKKNPKLIDGHINIDDYSISNQCMESIFQTAFKANHDVLILNDFGCISDNYPVDDVIDMINSCIYKYGHLFKYVVVSIHVVNQGTMSYFTRMNTKIIRPQIYLSEYMQSNTLEQGYVDHSLTQPTGMMSVQDNQSNQLNQLNPLNQPNQLNQPNPLNQLNPLNQQNEMFNLSLQLPRSPVSVQQPSQQN